MHHHVCIMYAMQKDEELHMSTPPQDPTIQSLDSWTLQSLDPTGAGWPPRGSFHQLPPQKTQRCDLPRRSQAKPEKRDWGSPQIIDLWPGLVI